MEPSKRHTAYSMRHAPGEFSEQTEPEPPVGWDWMAPSSLSNSQGEARGKERGKKGERKGQLDECQSLAFTRAKVVVCVVASQGRAGTRGAAAGAGVGGTYRLQNTEHTANARVGERARSNKTS